MYCYMDMMGSIMLLVYLVSVSYFLLWPIIFMDVVKVTRVKLCMIITSVTFYTLGFVSVGSLNHLKVRGELEKNKTNNKQFVVLAALGVSLLFAFLVCLYS